MTSTEQTGVTPKGGREQEPQPAEGHDRLDQLAEHLSDIEGPERDIAVYLAENWQRFVGSLVVVLLGVWVFGEFRAAQQRKLGESSARLTQVQQMFTSVQRSTNTNDESTLAAQKGLQDTLELLENSEGSGPYKGFASLYIAASELQAGKYVEAKKALEGFSVDQFLNGSKASKSLSSNTLTNELAALLMARIELAESPASANTGKKRLIGIAKTGSVTNVEALVILSRIAENEEQRKEVSVLAKAIIQERPAIADNVRQELSSQGYRL